MFALETPSRVLRRIERLEDEDDKLPDLPDLPSFDDDSNDFAEASAMNEDPHNNPEGGHDYDHDLVPHPNPSPRKDAQKVATLSDRTNSPLSHVRTTPRAKTESFEAVVYSRPKTPEEEETTTDDDAEEDDMPSLPSLHAPADDSLLTFPSVPGAASSIGEYEHDEEEEEEEVASSAGSSPHTALTTPRATTITAFATPQQQEPDSAALERRKMHLLTTLRSTAARPAFTAAATPRHPSGGGLRFTSHGSTFLPPSQQQQRPDSPRDRSGDERSYTSDTTSSNDLTTHAVIKANTSMPTTGVEENPTRFNGAKLNSYLHTLNTHLTEENQSLINALGEREGELDRLKRQVGRLEELSRSVVVDVEENSAEREEAVWEGVANERAEEIRQLKAELQMARQHAREEVTALSNRTDALLIDLEAKDAALSDARQEADAKNLAAEERIQQLEQELARYAENEQRTQGSTDEALEEAQGEIDHLQKLKLDLDSGIAQRDKEIVKLNADLDDFERQIDELDATNLESKRLCDEQKDTIAKLEEQLEVASKQVLAVEEELAHSRTQLNLERNVNKGLAAQLSSLTKHATKAKSPLANELSIDASGTTTGTVPAASPSSSSSSSSSSSTSPDLIASLEAELASTKAECEAVKAELNMLKTGDVEMMRTLEEKVAGLRKQVDEGLTPRKSYDKSVLFRSIVGVATPKTPRQFLSNLSSWSNNNNNSNADTTITPLLDQIRELEQIVHSLQDQLAEANAAIDAKLDQIDPHSLSVLRQLEEGQLKVVELEREKKEMMGDVERLRGDLERVKREVVVLERDIGEERRKAVEYEKTMKIRLEKLEQRANSTVPLPPAAATEDTEMEKVRLRHAQEAKGLLAQVRYLKFRVTREATFRSDLVYQKEYLADLLRQKQASIDSTLNTLVSMGLPRTVSPPLERSPRRSLKGAVRAIMAINRLTTLKNNWQKEKVSSMRLRTQAYPAVRGRPFPTTWLVQGE